MTWDADARIRVRPGVMVRVVDDILVLLDASSGRYFQLDEVGAKAWSLMVEGQPLAEVAAELQQTFEAGLDTITRDLADLAARLEAAGLIERSDDGR